MQSILKYVFLMFLAYPGTALAQTDDSSELPFYTLQLNIEPGRHLLKAKLTIAIDTSYAKNGTVDLLHNNGAVIEEISTQPQIKIDTTTIDEGFRKISIPVANGKTAAVLLNVKYSMKIPTDHQVNRITNEWIELNIDSFWLPLINGFPRFNYSMQLELDDSYQVMTGDKIESNDTGQMIISSALPRQDISFSATKKFHSVEGEFVSVSALHADTKIDSVKIAADRAMTFLSEYIDEPKDFKEKRKVVVSPREDVGYSRKNYIVLSDIRNERAISLAGFLCHEFSHYWFSEANPSTKHHWLSESFAEYLSLVFVREEFGQAEFDRNIAEKQRRVENDEKVLADYEERPSYLAMYVKGPLILHQFEHYLGNVKFKQLINSFVDLNIKTNEELFELVKKLFGKEAVVELKRLRASI
jgi:Peptidase family M1 domain